MKHEIRLILPAHEDFHQPQDFFLATDARVELAFTREGCEIYTVFLEGLE